MGEIDDPYLEREELAKLLFTRYDLWHEFKEIYVESQNLAEHELELLRKDVKEQLAGKDTQASSRTIPDERFVDKVNPANGSFRQRHFSDENLEGGSVYRGRDGRKVNGEGSYENIAEPGASELNVQHVQGHFPSHAPAVEQNIHRGDFRGDIMKGKEMRSLQGLIGQQWIISDDSVAQSLGQMFISGLANQKSADQIPREPVQIGSVMPPGLPHACFARNPVVDERHG